MHIIEWSLETRKIRTRCAFPITWHAILFHPVGIVVQHRVESESLRTFRGWERTLVHRARPATEQLKTRAMYFPVGSLSSVNR